MRENGIQTFGSSHPCVSSSRAPSRRALAFSPRFRLDSRTLDFNVFLERKVWFLGPRPGFNHHVLGPRGQIGDERFQTGRPANRHAGDSTVANAKDSRILRGQITSPPSDLMKRREFSRFDLNQCPDRISATVPTDQFQCHRFFSYFGFVRAIVTQ